MLMWHTVQLDTSQATHDMRMARAPQAVVDAPPQRDDVPVPGCGDSGVQGAEAQAPAHCTHMHLSEASVVMLFLTNMCCQQHTCEGQFQVFVNAWTWRYRGPGLPLVGAALLPAAQVDHCCRPRREAA